MFLDLHLFIFLFISIVFFTSHSSISPQIYQIIYCLHFFTLLTSSSQQTLLFGWAFGPCFFSYSTLVLWDSLYPIHSLFLVTLKFSVWLWLHGWVQNQYFRQPSVWLFHWAIPPIIHIQWDRNGTLCSSTLPPSFGLTPEEH